MNNNPNTNKVPEYILRNTRKYASNNREKINAKRKLSYFLSNCCKIIGNPEYSQQDKMDRIRKVKNYEIYENDPKFVDLINRKI